MNTSKSNSQLHLPSSEIRLPVMNDADVEWVDWGDGSANPEESQVMPWTT